MKKDFKFTIKSTSLDESYQPSNDTRLTTNFANLARGKYRQANLLIIKLINALKAL